MCVQAERGALESCVLELSGKAVALERWLADNESKNPQGEWLCIGYVSCQQG